MSKLIECDSCKGKGTRNCVLGCLTCGKCMGSGKLETEKSYDFVSCVQRQFGKEEKEETVTSKKEDEPVNEVPETPRPKGLWRGYDILTPEPGEYESMDCTTCGAKMNVTRNVESATSWAEGMGGGKHLHDEFICPNAGTDWHCQVIKLLQEVDETASLSVEKMIRKEIKDIIKTKKTTKNVGVF